MEVEAVHPYYSPMGSSTRAGTVSMAAHLTFWAIVVAIASRELQRRFPGGTPLRAPARDSVLTVLRDRYTHGDLDRAQLLQKVDDLRLTTPSCGEVPVRRDGAR